MVVLCCHIKLNTITMDAVKVNLIKGDYCKWEMNKTVWMIHSSGRIEWDGVKSHFSVQNCM